MNGLYRLQVLVDLADRLSGPITGVLGKIGALEQVTNMADIAMRRMQAGAVIAGTGLVLAAPLALATGKAIEFESAFSNVRKVVDFTPDYGPRGLQQDMLQLSNQIPVTAAGFTDIAAAGGQAGIAIKELAGFTKDVAKTTVAFDLTAREAGDTLAQLRNIFRANQKDVMLMADAVNYLSNVTAAKAPDILEVLRRTGPVGTQVRMAAKDISAFGAAMLSTGRQPEVVATGLNSLINRLSTASSQSKDFQAGLKMIGYSAKEVMQAVRTDATGTLVDFLQRVKGSKDMATTLGLLFGTQYSDDIAGLVNVLPDVIKNLDAMSSSVKYAGSVQREFETRSKTTANQLQLLKNRLTNIGIVIGQYFLPPLNKVLEVGNAVLMWVFDLVNNVPGLSAVLGTAVVVLALLVGGLGVAVTGLGALGFASAQARIGIAFLKDTFAGAMRQVRLFSLGIALLRFQIQSMGGPIAALRIGIGALTTAIRSFAVALLTNPIFLIIAAVVGLGAAFVWAWNNIKEFRDNVVSVLRPLRAAWFEFLAAVSQLRGAFAPIGDAIAGALGKGQSALDILAYGFGFFLGFTLTAVIWIFGKIGSVILQALTGVINIVRGFVDLIVGLFTGDLDLARKGVKEIFTGITQIITAPIRLFAPNWEALRGALTNAWNWVKDFALKMFQAGVDLAKGLADGIRSAIGLVGNAIRAVTGRAEQTYRVETQTRSPSRLFAYFGTMLSLGLAQGIQAGAPEVAAAMSSLADSPTMQAQVLMDTPSSNSGLGGVTGRKSSGNSYNFSFTFTVEENQKNAKAFAEEVAELATAKILATLEDAAMEEGYDGE